MCSRQIFSSAVSCDAEKLDINRFIGGAFLRYDTAFTVITTRERWNRMLDNLFLIGKLWEVYGFSPRYKVFPLGTVYHIVDPTGIEGMLRVVDSGRDHRTFLANGRMRNWYIPVTLTGRVLFLFRYSDEQGKVFVRLSVYGEGSENRIEQMMLRVLAPLLNVYIDRRITRNLRDLNMIITDMERSPDLIRGKIAGIYLEDFNRLVE